MNVKELADGKVLVICRAGCTNADIIGATGLHWDALFPAPDNTIAETARARRGVFPQRMFSRRFAGNAARGGVGVQPRGRGGAQRRGP
jgi:hypothetical protein